MDTSLAGHPTSQAGIDHETVVYLDLETTVVEARPGRTAPEAHLRPGVHEGLRRFRQVADRVVILVHPDPAVHEHGTLGVKEQLAEALRRLEPDFAEIAFVSCPHGRDERCACARPGSALIELATARLGLPSREGWHVSGDQTGVQTGRNAGLRTIRVGPAALDHLTSVHRPDYEARDLLDAANWVLVQAVSV